MSVTPRPPLKGTFKRSKRKKNADPLADLEQQFEQAFDQHMAAQTDIVELSVGQGERLLIRAPINEMSEHDRNVLREWAQRLMPEGAIIIPNSWQVEVVRVSRAK